VLFQEVTQCDRPAVAVGRSGETGARRIVEAEAEVVRHTFAEHLAGKSLRATARGRNADGTPAPAARALHRLDSPARPEGLLARRQGSVGGDGSGGGT